MSVVVQTVVGANLFIAQSLVICGHVMSKEILVGSQLHDHCDVITSHHGAGIKAANKNDSAESKLKVKVEWCCNGPRKVPAMTYRGHSQCMKADLRRLRWSAAFTLASTLTQSGSQSLTALKVRVVWHVNSVVTVTSAKCFTMAGAQRAVSCQWWGVSMSVVSLLWCEGYV